MRAQAAGTHRHAATAPAVAGDDHLETGDQQVRGADDAVQRALPGAVAVVEEVLGHRVVHGHDGIGQDPLAGHAREADDAGGRFLRAADDAGKKIPLLRVQHRDQVGPVVHGQVRPAFERRQDVAVVSVVVLALDREHGDAVVLDQGGRDSVLGGERIAAAQPHLRASGGKGAGEVGGLGRHVKAGRQAQALEGLLAREALADGAHDRHLGVGPIDAGAPFRGQGDVLDVTCDLGHGPPLPRTGAC